MYHLSETEGVFYLRNRQTSINLACFFLWPPLIDGVLLILTYRKRWGLERSTQLSSLQVFSQAVLADK